MSSNHGLYKENNPMKMLRTILCFIIALLLLLPFAPPVLAQPPWPEAYYGGLTFTVNDGEKEDAPPGTEVIAKFQGSEEIVGRLEKAYGVEVTTTESGKYGGPTLDDAKLLVRGEEGDQGRIIEFFFKLPTGTEWIQAGQTSTYSPGGPTELDLTASFSDTQPPTAEAGENQVGDPNQELTFDGTASTDDYGIESYQWDFGDGTSASGATVSHAYSGGGTYTVTLTVTDFGDNTATDTLIVTIATPIPDEPEVSDEAKAEDTEGHDVPVTSGGEILFQSGPDGLKLVLPVKLKQGETLESFTDPDTGITFSQNTLTIPVKDSQGILVMTIFAKTGDAQGTGDTAVAKIESLWLETVEKAEDFSSRDASVGTAACWIKANLIQMPQNAYLAVGLAKSPSSEAEEAFRQAAQEARKQIVDIAFVVEVVKTNMVDGTDVGEVTLHIKVGRAWVEKYGEDSIRVLRLTEEGQVELLRPESITYDDGTAIIKVISPNGLSVFGLAAVQPITSINWFLIGGAIAGVGIIGSASYFVVRRRNRKSKSA